MQKRFLALVSTIYKNNIPCKQAISRKIKIDLLFIIANSIFHTKITFREDGTTFFTVPGKPRLLWGNERMGSAIDFDSTRMRDTNGPEGTSKVSLVLHTKFCNPSVFASNKKEK